jgi:hypothetical protein
MPKSEAGASKATDGAEWPGFIKRVNLYLGHSMVPRQEWLKESGLKCSVSKIDQEIPCSTLECVEHPNSIAKEGSC